MAKRKARDLVKEAHWRMVVSGQQRSGQAVRQYCRAKSVSESSFWYWKGELARRDSETGRKLKRGASQRPRIAGQRRGAPSIVPVTIGPAVSTAVPIEVLFSGGTRLRVSSGCDEAMLRMVLSTLESHS
jgi:hypothetical protein